MCSEVFNGQLIHYFCGSVDKRRKGLHLPSALYRGLLPMVGFVVTRYRDIVASDVRRDSYQLPLTRVCGVVILCNVTNVCGGRLLSL